MTLSSSAAAAALVGNSKDLVCEILSRLPLTEVIRFRLVCKEWRSLASTQSFIDMHQNINQTPPSFVFQYFNYRSSSDYFSDCTTSKLSNDHFNTLFFNLYENNNNNMTIKSVREYINLTSNFGLLGGGEGEEEEKIYYQLTNFFHEKTYYDIKLISSCRGFLLFTAKSAAANMSMSARFRRWLIKDKEEEYPALILYNPVTKEQHTVTAPPSTHVYCGFYYHSPTKEHRILYQLMFDHEYQAGVVKFLVFGLQTKSTRVLELKVNNYIATDSNSKDYYHIDTWTPPVISNGSLHWFVSEDNLRSRQIPSCSQSILSFGIESEEFHTMPHPPLSHTCSIRYTHKGLSCHDMNLLEMEGGILCLSDGYGSVDQFRKPILEIYVMEDYKKWTWIRRYRIDLSEYIHVGYEYGLCYKALQILPGGQLLLHYRSEICWHDVCHYALYSLNEHEDGRPLSSASSITGMVTKSPFQIIMDGYSHKKVINRLARMIIRSPSSVGSNMVVLTPSLASFQHNGSATSIRTFFSIRTNHGYEYI